MSESTAAPDHADGMRSEAVREAVSMALYQSLSLLAVLFATPEPDADREGGAIALTVALTGIGLLRRRIGSSGPSCAARSPWWSPPPCRPCSGDPPG